MSTVPDRSSFQPLPKSSTKNKMFSFSSPVSDEYHGGGGKLICSPPCVPVKHDEPSPASLDAQLKSGRSLLNSKPTPLRLNLRTHAGAVGSAQMQPLPAFPRSFMPPVQSEDDDMPAVVTPIKLKMRQSKEYQGKPSVESPEPCSRDSDCLFAPIRSCDCDEDSCA